MSSKKSQFVKWNAKSLTELYHLREEEGKTFKEIAKILKIKASIVTAKFRRVQWDEFLKDPEGYLEGYGKIKKWTDEEMIQLDAYIQAAKSYDFIADKLGRSIVSVERQSQQTDWKAWRELRNADPSEMDDADGAEDDENRKRAMVDQYVAAISPHIIHFLTHRSR